jgi:putative ubiquitin-RnfH superfamily antitoxin RatB of RatAB toxin-antitoxin module
MPSESPDRTVEVVYALPQLQRIVRVPFEPGLTAEEAVRRSGLQAEFPEIAREPLVLGVYGVRVPSTQPLRPGDRVEVGRRLRRDPRDRRREQAA